MTLEVLTSPVSTNSLYAHTGRRRFMTDRGARNKEAIGWEARTQYRGNPLEGPLKVSLALYWPDKRKHDIDNIKGMLDALTGIVWEDDSQIDDLHITKHIDKKEPRAVLEIMPTAA